MLLDQDLGTLHTFNTAVVPEYPGIDLGTDFGIYGVDGNGDVVDVVLGQLIYAGRQCQTISRYTQFNIGPAIPNTVICGIVAATALVFLTAWSGVSNSETTPGRDSLAQSYLRLQ